MTERHPDESAATLHEKDADCLLDERDMCRGCGTYHGDPCPTCGGRGFHSGGCPDVNGGYMTPRESRAFMLRHNFMVPR